MWRCAPASVPEEPDNVVQPFVDECTRLYGSAEYLATRPAPHTDADLAAHDFVSLDDAGSRAPFIRWLHQTVPEERIVFRANDANSMREAVLAGVGLGVRGGLGRRTAPRACVPVLETREEWRVPLWLVTHVDLHRTTKVQAFLQFLKEDARSW